MQDVPFSVAAPDRGELRRRGVEDLEGVAANVGRLHRAEPRTRPEPGRDPRRLRGPDRARPAGVKEQVGVYLDESVISLSLFTPDLDLFDMNRVEVLRGPQGTLFGSGSRVGHGALHHQPARARRDARRSASSAAARVDGGSPGGNVKLGFNVPLGDTAALRVAGYYNRLAGYIDAGAARTCTRQGGRQHRRPHRRARGGHDRAERSPHHHAAPRLPEASTTDGWNRDRRLQHPGQPVHDDAAGGDARRARAVHAARGAVHRQVRARRPEHRLQLRQRGRSPRSPPTPTATSWSSATRPR